MKFSFKIPNYIFLGSAVAGSFGIACIIKSNMGDYYPEAVFAENKVVIVTGANSGIGKETVRELALREAKVYMACRDLKKCEEARKQIVIETENKYVYCRKCDLASLESIKKFVTDFKKENKELHILINNGGVMRTPKSKTKEGFEMQLGVNHMGHFLLTNLLLDTLEKSSPSRIINVSSVAHYRGKINKEDLNSEQNYDAGEAYAQSKLANILFTKELAERLKGTNVTVNAVHPGTVDTAIVRHMSFYNSWLSAIIIKPFAWPFIKSPKQGAQTTIFAALDPSLEKVSGQFFSDFVEKEASIEANDKELGKWLWKVSEKWTKLDEYLKA